MKLCSIEDFGIYDSKMNYPLHAPLTISPWRSVDVFEFDYILACDRGAQSFINDKSQQLFPGLIIVRKPGERSHSRLHFRCYGLHICAEPESEFYKEVSLLPSYYTFTAGEIYHTIFSELFRHLVKSNENVKSYFTYSKILELIYHLKKDADKNRKSVASPRGKEILSVDMAIGYMKKNYSQNISLDSLGKLTGYSPNHFRTIFSAAMNISPQKYLEKIRIDQAKFLLVQNEMSIAEVAYATGFSSQSYFTKAFKEVTGQTPGEFIKGAYLKHD